MDSRRNAGVPRRSSLLGRVVPRQLQRANWPRVNGADTSNCPSDTVRKGAILEKQRSESEPRARQSHWTQILSETSVGQVIRTRHTLACRSGRCRRPPDVTRPGRSCDLSEHLAGDQAASVLCYQTITVGIPMPPVGGCSIEVIPKQATVRFSAALSGVFLSIFHSTYFFFTSFLFFLFFRV